MACCQRQQCQIAGTFNCLGDLALVLGAVTGDPAWYDFAPLGDEVAQGAWVFVVNGCIFLGAETANLAALKRTLLTWTAGAAIWTGAAWATAWTGGGSG